MRPLPRPLRAALAPLALAAAACASGSSMPVNDPGAGTFNSTRIDFPQGTVTVDNVRSNPGASTVDVAAAPEQAFDQLSGVYDELGVPINMVSSESRTIGAREQRVARRLGKTAVSRYVVCGPDAVGTDRADSYAVTLTVLSRVSPTGGADAAASSTAAGLGPRSTVVTQVLASAQPISVSGQAIQCGSTGQLERAIHNSLNLRLAALAATAPKK